MTETWDWPSQMRKVARRFNGREGVVIQLGDSLTLACPNAIWARSGKGHTPEELAFLKWAHAGVNDERDGWYLATHETVSDERSITTCTATVGCSAQYVLTGRRGLPPLKELLSTYNPQMAVYAVGMSDVLRNTPLGTYLKQVAKAITLLKKNGTIPVLSTLTPSPAHNVKALRVSQALREFAKAERLPLLDMYAEMEKRNKNVFEFMAEDGLHLTADPPDGPPTEENLRTSGYLLRCYLTVRKLMEVKQRVLDVLELQPRSTRRSIVQPILRLWRQAI